MDDGADCDTAGVCVAGTCRVRRCSDGWREPAPSPFGREGCDDGNTEAGDACDPSCVPVPLRLDDTEGSASRPVLAEDGSGALLAVWVETTAEAEPTQRVRARRLDPGGVPDGASFVLEASIASGLDVRPVVSGLSSGWAVAWRSPFIDSDLGGVAFAVVGRTGAPGALRRANETTRGEQREPAIAAVTVGFVVAWTDASGTSSADPGLGVRARRFDETGRALGSQFEVPVTRAGDQSQPALAALGETWAVAWTDASSGTPQIRARRFAGGASLDGADLVVSSALGTEPALAHSRSGLAITWTSRTSDVRGDIEARWLPNDATEPAESVWSFGAATTRDERSTVAVRPDAGLVAAWRTEGLPRGLRIESSSPFAPEVDDLRVRVTGAAQDDVHLANGRQALWVTWSERTSSGSRGAFAFALPWD